MNKSAISGCGTCGKAMLISPRSDKWGQCAFCAAVAFGGALTGWSLTLTFWIIHYDARIVMTVAGLSGCFTVVLALHLVAYLRSVILSRRTAQR